MRRDVEFIYEMGTMRRLPRMWQRLNTPDFANHAEHAFRVFWIAMLIAEREGADSGRVAKLCMVHDVAENRTGDVDIIARQYSEPKADMAIQDILEDTAIADEYYELWQEYEAKETLEAKVAKDADNLDVDFELAEQAAMGNNIGEAKAEIRKYVAANKLYTDTAKELHAKMKEVGVHDWWKESKRNRRNAGDWKSSGAK